MMKNSNHSGPANKSSVPEARAALDGMKMEIAKELGIDLRQVHKGDLPSRVAGQMVKYMIRQREESMGSQGKKPLH